MRTSKNGYGRISSGRSVVRKGYYRLQDGPVGPPESEMSREQFESIMMADEEQQYQKEKSSGIEVEENNVYFYTDITPKSSLELVRILNRLDIELSYLAARMGLEKNPPIKLHIGSPGGCLYSTLNVCDAIDRCKTEVHTYVEGFVASGGTVISTRGKKRFMNKNSFMLVHQPALMFWSGKHDDFQDEVINQDLAYVAVKNSYLSVSKISSEALDELMKHELHLPASKCLEYGFIDEII